MTYKKNIFKLIVLLFVFNIYSNTAEKDLKNKIRIAYWSSWKIKCGIAMYTEHIYTSLKKRGYNVVVYPHTTPIDTLLQNLKDSKINIINIQYERGLFHHIAQKTVFKNVDEFIATIKKIKDLGVKVIFTMHVEESDSYKLLQLADQCIYHRTSKFNTPKINLIPIGVPVFNSRKLNRNLLRKKYGFGPKDKIITTVGFMLAPKKYPEVLNALSHLIKSDRNIKIQLLTSFTNRPILHKQSLHENLKIKTIIKVNRIGKQVTHITNFLTQQEMSERLWISDLGYVWGDNESRASSASIKEFIAAKLPFIANDCLRYENDAIPGIIKTPNNKVLFVTKIMQTIYDQNLIILKNKLEAFYNQMNYDKLIQKHIKIFNKAFTN